VNSLARTLPPVLCAVLVAACSQTPAPKPAAETQNKAPTPVPTPTPASPGLAKMNLLEALGGGKHPTAGPEDEGAEERRADKRIEIIIDPATGKRLQKIPKDPTLFERNGHLFSVIVADSNGIPLVRSDEGFYYVEAEPELTAEEMAKRRAAREVAASNLPPIWELPKEEAEVVTPPVSKRRIRLENLSGGLPRAGIWRDNFALADLDGDGRPEIVSPPPRLSAQGLRIFKWTGERWKSVTPLLENPENLHISYGGVAAGDLDRDGRTDIVWGGHGEGMWVAYNLGDFRFRVESRGLPRAISTRAVAVGDLDGDGREDILVVSDKPEGLFTRGKPRAESSGYLEGFDVRAYLDKGDRFVELIAGLDDKPCFAYSIALSARPSDGGAPFFVSGCRYNYGVNLLYEFDRSQMAFRNVGTKVAESFTVHLGSAVGTFKNFPAAFVTYMKNTPGSAQPNITGDGVSIYYRDGSTWNRFRLLKRVGERGSSAGIAVGDLDGDGLDDVVFADDLTRRVRIFFQNPSGGFEELDPALEPTFINSPSSVRIGDVDGDGRADIVLMTHYLTAQETRYGGFLFFRNLPSK
jgi:hypothetical protein